MLLRTIITKTILFANPQAKVPPPPSSGWFRRKGYKIKRAFLRSFTREDAVREVRKGTRVFLTFLKVRSHPLLAYRLQLPYLWYCTEPQVPRAWREPPLPKTCVMRVRDHVLACWVQVKAAL